MIRNIGKSLMWGGSIGLICYADSKGQEGNYLMYGVWYAIGIFSISLYFTVKDKKK